MPKSVVVDTAFEWSDDHKPRTHWHDTIIYETHVRGLTLRHPDVPPAHRGTYSGLAHPSIIEHFQRLGVTAVELMPVHQFVHDHRLAKRGLRNYWGYNSIGFFAPHNGYAFRAGQRVVNEFKTMVRALHAAGIEVILDVVYNHTAEGDHTGPTLSFRGLDNPTYYRLDPDNPRLYSDTTGTGNSLNVSSPNTLQLLMDSLRYWVLEMHVDGFRFDLAASLARQFHEVDRLSAFFDLIHQDPVISQIKLIAEPWDLGSGGYQVGNFPVLWSEWNGRYRDSVRDYWRQQGKSIEELAAPPDWQPRPLRGDRPAPLGQRQLRDRPRRLHHGRHGQLQRQAQRGERRGQQRRHRRQPQLELRCRRPDRRPGHRGPAQAAGPQSPDDTGPVARRANAPRRR